MWNSLGDDAIVNLAVSIEHMAWREKFLGAFVVSDGTPENGTEIEVSAQQDYNGTTYGQEATSQYVSVFVANKQNKANITHIFRYTAAGGAWSANLVGAAVPYDIFPGAAAGPANNDLTYFGCDVGLADSGPFSNLVFDVLAGMTFGVGDGIIVEYWNGAWVQLIAATQWFRFADRLMIMWEQPSDWAATVINGVNALWVRFRIVEVAGVSRVQQKGRGIYSCVTPFAEIAASQLPGTLPALMEMSLGSELGLSNEGPLLAYTNRVHVGARSLDRQYADDTFTAYLNCADEQNSADASFSALAATATIVTDLTTPTGRRVTYAPAGLTTDEQVCFWNLQNRSFAGTYHAYLRYQLSAGSADGDFSVRLIVTSGSGIGGYRSLPVSCSAVAAWNVADLGVITFPPGNQTDVALNGEGDIVIAASCFSAARSLYLYDLVIIPVDEWSMMAEEDVGGQILVGSSAPLTKLRIDSLSRPASPLSSLMSSTFLAVYPYYGAEAFALRAGGKTRLWFFMGGSTPASNAVRRYNISQYLGVQVARCAQYKGMRGAS